MVRAILEGRKTQTRRVIKPQPPAGVATVFGGGQALLEWKDGGPAARCIVPQPKCPHGQVGDRLWVGEAFKLFPKDTSDRDWRGGKTQNVIYKADPDSGFMQKGYKPSSHMPRWASRITLEITAVRVERLGDISEADAEAEGAERLLMDDEGKFYQQERGTFRTGFAGLWCHINGPDSWDANPWVWVIEFKRVQP